MPLLSIFIDYRFQEHNFNFGKFVENKLNDIDTHPTGADDLNKISEVIICTAEEHLDRVTMSHSQ